MTRDTNGNINLRRRAEELHGANKSGESAPRSEQENLALLHELEVYQIELEIQNSELSQSRNALEAVLDKYSDIYDVAPVGYCTLDCAGTIHAANLTAASMFGLERSRVVGRRFGQFVADEARLSFIAFLERVFTGQGKESIEMTLLKGGGQLLIVQIDAISIASGRECQAVLVDITRRRQAEELLNEKRLKLEELNRTLEVRIDLAVNDLRKKDSMIFHQDRLAVMGEMIGNIAHQWRQPLNTLGLFTQRIGAFYGTPSFNKEFLDTSIAKSMEIIQYMSRTIDDFRSFFSTEREKSDFRVDEAVNKALSLVEANFKEHRIHVERIGDEPVVLYGFPNEYAQVLLNILINAKDALDKQDVKDPRVTVAIGSENGISVVTITDNAGGIPADIIDKVFDPYFSTKGPQQGSGVGLFMSKNIIETSMGGRLSVRNTDVGAEFRIEV